MLITLASGLAGLLPVRWAPVISLVGVGSSWSGSSWSATS
jgi:hypothetical protein